MFSSTQSTEHLISCHITSLYQNRGVPKSLYKLHLYTDGSKMEDLSGAGMLVVNDGQVLDRQSYFLGNHPTVFQCEMYALKKAATWIIENAHKFQNTVSVSVFSDSQAALLALNKVFVKSELVASTIETLNKAANIPWIDNLVIHWVKAHVGHKFNEEVDTLAKAGAENLSFLVSDLPKLSRAVMHLEIDKLSTKMWCAQWVNSLKPDGTPMYRQTKHWFPGGPVPALSFGLLSLSRVAYGQMVGFLTGHNFLKRHQSLIDGDEEAPDKWCNFCGGGGEQTTEHIMSFCEALASLRLEVFGDPSPRQPFTEIKLGNLFLFLKEAKIKSLELFDTFEDAVENLQTDSSSSGTEGEEV